MEKDSNGGFGDKSRQKCAEKKVQANYESL